MANAQTNFIGGAGLRRFGRPVLGAGYRGLRRHDGNRKHELRPLAVYSCTSTGGNNLDLWVLDGTQLRCRSERTDSDESRNGSGGARSQENMRSAPVAGIGQRRMDRLP